MRIGFVSLGCPKNLVDTEIMMGQLRAHGHELTPHPEEAEVIVVNTCSFIDPAKQESVDTILEMAQYKKTGQASKLVVAGCMVERYRGEILESLPEVDAVIGTNEVEQITAVCEGHAPAANRLEPYLYHESTPRVLSTPRHYAYVKIAEGCDHPCAFCVIPQFRGPFRSRRFESVVTEVTGLLAQGVREVNLIGQDTTSYGADLGLKDGLAELLRRLAEIPAPHQKWVRFLYAYPNQVSGKLLDTIAAHDSVVSYIDIPLQHANARVLKRMKRGGSGDIFLKLIERMRAAIPGVTIRTSMIVGFPGETQADFDELCQFVEAAQFDRLGVFSYSDEETSQSYALDHKVGKRTIYNRRRRLMSIQRRISRRRNRALQGREVTVLVDGPSPETELLWEARMPAQAPEIDGVCYITDDAGAALRPGQIRRLRIEQTYDFDLTGALVGEVVDEAPPVPPGELFPILPAGARPPASAGSRPVQPAGDPRAASARPRL